jgi:transposase
MALLEEIKIREQQICELSSTISSVHAKLKIAYETQQIELVDYKQKANYWEVQFSQLKTRELGLQSELEDTRALLKKREQQLFGRRSEKSSKHSEKSNTSTDGAEVKKKRGQQPGSKGHGRKDYSHLPQVEETHELPLDEQKCQCCGLDFEELGGTEDSRVIEIINVKAYQRVIHRKRYQRACQCKDGGPKIQLAPNTEKLYPKATLGVSVWAYLLVYKYDYYLPLNRILKQLNSSELSLSAGTLTDGMQKLVPLFLPAYNEIIERSLTGKHWHADETGWKVFEAIEGKKNNRWFMWIFHNDETVVYKICPSRSSKVLIEHFGEEHPGGTLNVDRYSAYKVIAKAGLFILAFCWAHVRRDFLEYAKGYPHNETWALNWIDDIAKLYHINNQRLKFKPKSKTFRDHQQSLINQIKKMEALINKQLEDEQLLPSAKKILKSLKNHWDGLTVFVNEPSIPMDNNLAERGLRGPILGRNGYYGSGAVWSSVLSAMMFTICKTLHLAKLNCHTWLLAYLQECAMNSGVPPDDIQKFLPWNMTQKQQEIFSLPPSGEINTPELN